MPGSRIPVAPAKEAVMAITPPSRDDLARIAGQYGFTLSPGDLESFRGLVAGRARVV